MKGAPNTCEELEIMSVRRDLVNPVPDTTDHYNVTVPKDCGDVFTGLSNWRLQD